MLRRQWMVLALLLEAKRTLARASVERLLFLLRQETQGGRDSDLYDFVPSSAGPVSFTFARDAERLRNQRLVTGEAERMMLPLKVLPEVRRLIARLPASARDSIRSLLAGHGRMGQQALLDEIRLRFPWYVDGDPFKYSANGASDCSQASASVVYSLGYESLSIDAFMNRLLLEGIRCIADVRFHPISRKFGFSRKTLQTIADRMGIRYRHFPTLGIPGADRTNLDGFASYQRLLDVYERRVLAKNPRELTELVTQVVAEPTVLICVEQDVRCCHRSRLSDTVSRRSGFEIRHLSTADHPCNDLAALP